MTKEQKFAKEMSELIFEMHIESSIFKYNKIFGIINKNYIKNIIDDPKHSRIIHGLMYDNILADIMENPAAFKKENKNMQFCYSPEVYDYSKHINKYIHQMYEKDKWKQMNIKYKVWIEIKRIEYDPETENEQYFNEENPTAVAYRENLTEAIELQNLILNNFREI